VSVKRSHKVAINQRRAKVADLYLQGWPQMQIAAHLGCAQTTVSSDLRRIQQQWRESAVRDFDLAREIELHKIDRVERECWSAWERSQKPAQSAHISDETHQRRTRRHVRNQYGDPRFMEQVNKCIAMRCSLLGLYRTPQVETDGDGISIAERGARVVTIIASLRDRERDAPVGAGPGGDEPRLLCADGVGPSRNAHGIPLNDRPTHPVTPNNVNTCPNIYTLQLSHRVWAHLRERL
jgi:hypothetical protein